jgi:hypothetical protein
MQLMQIHQQLGAGQNTRFSNISAGNSHNYVSEEGSGVMMGVSDEFQEQGTRHQSSTLADFNRGRQQSATYQKVQPVYQKTQSSPSKMFRQFNPHAAASRSPYRNIVDKSESSSIGPQTQSSYNYQPQGLNISPIKQGQSKFANDKAG